MAKAALLINGQIRTFAQCFPVFVEKIIKENPEYEWDVFCIVNTTPDIKRTCSAPRILPVYNFKYLKIEESDPVLPDLSYQYDHYINKEWDPDNDCRVKKHYICAFYQLYWMKELMKQVPGGYDFSVRLRTDTMLSSTIKLRELDPGKIWIPIGNSFGGYNDRLAVGGGELMRTYMNRFYY